MSRAKAQGDFSWVASQLNQLRTVQPDGKIAFSSFGNEISFDHLITIIETYHDFEADVPDNERHRIVVIAVMEAAKTGEITEKSLKQHVFQQANQFKNRLYSDYVLVTSISMNRPDDLHRLTFDDASFVFADSLPRSYSRHRIEVLQNKTLPNDFPDGFTTIRVRVKARSEFEAFERAMNSLNYLRGIWNYRLNRGVLNRVSFGLAKPINTIILGSVHTLHLPTGEPATMIARYEHFYSDINPINLDKKIWSGIKKDENTIRKCIDASKYPEFIRNMFIKYAHSLDGIDHQQSFLKLWSLLESLTVIKEDENYGDLIKRSLFLSMNETYDRQVLEHLRIRRNDSVHRGEYSNHAQAFIFQLKRYVEGLMRFHLTFGRRFSKVEEVGQFLSKSRDVNALEKRIADLESELSLNKAALKLRKQINKQ